MINARDLAAWLVTTVEEETAGVFNAVGPSVPMADVIDACGDSDAKATSVDEDFLLDRDVVPWMELPLWMPEDDPSGAGSCGSAATGPTQTA